MFAVAVFSDSPFKYVKCLVGLLYLRFFFQAEDGIRDFHVTGVQTCALPISGLSRVGGEIRVIKKEQTADSPECKPKVVKPDIVVNEYKTLINIVDGGRCTEVGDRHRTLYNITDLEIECVACASRLEVVVRFYLDAVDPDGEIYLVGLVERTCVVLNGKPHLPSLTADAEEHPSITLKLHKVPPGGVVCIGYVRSVWVEREGYAKVIGSRVTFFIPPRRPVSSGLRLLVSRT